MSARIITDVRPVFDTAGEKIVETVITHMLALQYQDGTEGPRLMTVALDQADIVALRKQCERAERKSKVVMDAISNLNPSLFEGR